jgi:hypothetical protein
MNADVTEYQLSYSLELLSYTKYYSSPIPPS